MTLPILLVHENEHDWKCLRGLQNVLQNTLPTTNKLHSCWPQRAYNDLCITLKDNARLSRPPTISRHHCHSSAAPESSIKVETWHTQREWGIAEFVTGKCRGTHFHIFLKNHYKVPVFIFSLFRLLLTVNLLNIILILRRVFGMFPDGILLSVNFFKFQLKYFQNFVSNYPKRPHIFHNFHYLLPWF